MGKIPARAEQKIKDAMNIMDVVQDDLGVVLHKKGHDYEGLCPFHDDRSLGNFHVDPQKNICKCFACSDKAMDPIKALMVGKKMDYNTALRHLAARYNILIDDEPVPVVKKAEPRVAPPPKPIMFWPVSLASGSVRYRQEHGDNLSRFFDSLPLTKEDRERQRAAMELYMVGTSEKGDTQGWTIWWFIDENMNLCRGKLMAYKPDAHRDKDVKPKWAHNLLARVGKFDKNVYDTKWPLFGMHLIDIFPDARICIVESEKTAVGMSAYADMKKRLWLATGGKSNLNGTNLKPLFDRGREIEVHPDMDGYEEWQKTVDGLKYDKIWVSQRVKRYWTEADGEKADIFDITLRLLNDRPETTSETAHKLLGMAEENKALTALINNLKLEID